LEQIRQQAVAVQEPLAHPASVVEMAVQQRVLALRQAATARAAEQQQAARQYAAARQLVVRHFLAVQRRVAAQRRGQLPFFSALQNSLCGPGMR
jgi:hypothetical protein